MMDRNQSHAPQMNSLVDASCPDLSGMTVSGIADELKVYSFMDDHGHPLELNVLYLELIRRAGSHAVLIEQLQRNV